MLETRRDTDADVTVNPPALAKRPVSVVPHSRAGSRENRRRKKHHPAATGSSPVLADASLTPLTLVVRAHGDPVEYADLCSAARLVASSVASSAEGSPPCRSVDVSLP